MSDPRLLLSVSDSSALLITEVDAKSVAEAVMGWRDAGLTVRSVRGRKMRTVGGLFDEMAAALQFPYYFGENWPAFDECLADMDWLLPVNAGIVILVYDALEVLADAEETELTVLVRSIEAARRSYSEPIELGEWWDRPAVPFHVVLHSANPKDSRVLRARWQKADATILDLTDLPQKTAAACWRDRLGHRIEGSSGSR